MSGSPALGWRTRPRVSNSESHPPSSTPTCQMDMPMSPSDAQRTARPERRRSSSASSRCLPCSRPATLVYVEHGRASRRASTGSPSGCSPPCCSSARTKTALWMRFGSGGEVTPGYAFAYALALLGSPAGAVAVMALDERLCRHQEPQAAPQDPVQRRRHLARALDRRTGVARCSASTAPSPPTARSR